MTPLFRIVIVCLMLTGLTACHRESTYVENPVMRNLTSEQQTLLFQIEGAGVQIIKQGMSFIFVIPTDCFFSKESRKLKAHREMVLDRLAQFLNSYAHYFSDTKIVVTGYTDKTWVEPARDQLAKHYANTVANYLCEDGVNSNIIKVMGAGAKNPIASNRYPMGTSFNRRVEVVVE